jgi:hypothetical protein
MNKWKIVIIDNAGNVSVEVVDDTYLQAHAYNIFSGQICTAHGAYGVVLRIEKFLDVPVEASDVQA